MLVSCRVPLHTALTQPNPRQTQALTPVQKVLTASTWDGPAGGDGGGGSASVAWEGPSSSFSWAYGAACRPHLSCANQRTGLREADCRCHCCQPLHSIVEFEDNSAVAFKRALLLHRLGIDIGLELFMQGNFCLTQSLTSVLTASEVSTEDIQASQ